MPWSYPKGVPIFADFPEGGSPLLCSISGRLKNGGVRCEVVNGGWTIRFDRDGNTIGHHPACHPSVVRAVVKLNEPLLPRGDYNEQIREALDRLKARTA